MIMLERINVCFIAWYTIMDVSKVTYYHWKVNANNAIHIDHHGNVGTTTLQIHIFQATAILHLMLEQFADHMLHKMRILET